MAAFMMNNAYLTVNGVALSDHVTSITFSREADQLETTAMGDNNRTYIGGLQTGTLDLEMNQDLASGEVEATLYTLLGTTTTCVVKNDGSNADYAGARVCHENISKIAYDENKGWHTGMHRVLQELER